MSVNRHQHYISLPGTRLKHPIPVVAASGNAQRQTVAITVKGNKMPLRNLSANNILLLTLKQALTALPHLNGYQLVISGTVSQIAPVLKQFTHHNKVYLLHAMRSIKGLTQVLHFCQTNHIGLVLDVTRYPETDWTALTKQNTIGMYFCQQIAGEGVPEKLRALRQEVAACDEQIVAQLNRRMALIQKISRLKKQGNMPAFQPARFISHLLFLLGTAEGKKLSPETTLALYQHLHELALRQQA